MTEIWREVMRLDAIGTDDDFFDLGGHSLLITQIVGRVKTVFGVQLSLRDFFEAPTIGGLTELIERHILTEVQQMPEIQAERLAAEALAVGA
jgi:acyl carrier protein